MGIQRNSDEAEESHTQFQLWSLNRETKKKEIKSEKKICLKLLDALREVRHTKWMDLFGFYAISYFCSDSLFYDAGLHASHKTFISFFIYIE